MAKKVQQVWKVQLDQKDLMVKQAPLVETVGTAFQVYLVDQEMQDQKETKVSLDNLVL